jgi:hypothetical protein
MPERLKPGHPRIQKYEGGLAAKLDRNGVKSRKKGLEDVNET